MPEDKPTPFQSDSPSGSQNGDLVYTDYRQDPLFTDLLMSYQKADWKKCREIITALKARYPDEPVLDEFNSDIETQTMLYRTSQKETRISTQYRLANIFRVITVFLLTLALLAFVLFQMGQVYTQRMAAQSAQAAELEAENLKAKQVALEAKAQGLLQSGRAEEARKAVDELEAADPTNANLPAMRSEVAHLLELEGQYQSAMSYVGKDDDQALLLFTKIQETNPNYKDVSRQVERIQNAQTVVALVADAQTAYTEKRWMDVISLYNQALVKDGSVNSDQVKNEMVNSYLRSIIETLSKERPTLQELSTCESYYRKAIALVPQDKRYVQEREELRQLSVELLITKHYQTARLFLEDPLHTETQVRQAVGLLSVAYNLGPEKVYLNAELTKAQLYLTALTAFDNRQWDTAIQGLSDLARFDNTYPNGMLRQLIFEAYSALGHKYYAGGFYLDARKNYDAAEIIAWEQPENRLRLYQVQVDLGYTLGKLDLYKDAVSYFKYALDRIEIDQRAASNPDLVTALKQVNELVVKGDDQEAYASYLQLLPKVEALYLQQEVEVSLGANLGFIASSNHSTILAIQQLNGLGDAVIITRSQTLIIPSLP